MKGMVFTYDALIALSFFLFFIGSIFFIYNVDYYDDVAIMMGEKRNTYLAQDIIITLNAFKFEMLNESIKKNISQELNISGDLLNSKAISEILLLLWVKNKSYVIDDVFYSLYHFLPDIAQFNISIITSSNNVIISNYSFESDVVHTAYTYLTGYEENQEPLGYVAKAFATKIQKNTTKIYVLSPQGAANVDGWITITKYFYVNSSPDNITNAVFYLSLHKGQNTEDIDYVLINGNDVYSSVVWLWQIDSSTGQGAFGYVDIMPYLQEGWNTLQMRFRNPWFNAHIHPGSRIEITYSDDSFYKGRKDVEEYLYYEDIYSQETSIYGTGAWATMEYSIPLNSNINNVTLHLSLRGIENAGWWWSWDDWTWYNWDVRVYVNGNLIDEIRNPDFNMDLYYDLTPYTVPGTNYVVFYANTYGNRFLGDDYTHVYSDPVNDPYGSTYIYVNYTYNDNPILYGNIDITLNELLGGVAENPKSYDIDFEGKSLLSTYLHIAQIFSYTIGVDVNGNEVFASTFPRGIPSKIFIDPSHFIASGTNTITIEDGCSGCDYLPESSFEYTILIPSHVGYGNVFPSKDDAMRDAVQRLRNVLGRYVDATEIRNETASIGNIPYLYGPLKLAVSVW